MSIADIDKRGAFPSFLKWKDSIDLEIPHTPKTNGDPLLKIESTLLKNWTWEEIAWKLDEVNKASSSKTSYPINASDNDRTIKDKLSNIYPMTIKLTNYGIGEFSIDDVIFNIPIAQ